MQNPRNAAAEGHSNRQIPLLLQPHAACAAIGGALFPEQHIHQLVAQAILREGELHQTPGLGRHRGFAKL